jgi:hypothetical protein
LLAVAVEAVLVTKLMEDTQVLVVVVQVVTELL